MIKDNILKIKERIFLICSKLGRDGNQITIVSVNKNIDLDKIKEAIDSGITDLGENRVQEALIKYNALSVNSARLPVVKWHMVGHLQTNKVKQAVRIFDMIQSVDSARLAFEIDKQAARIDKIQDILIEIKTSSETTKYGIRPDDAIGIIKEISSLKNVNIRGLMTIAPLMDNPQKTRPYFRILRELLGEINMQQISSASLQILSMGMTDDFGIAIEEGSTMVRLGRAIFEGSNEK